MKKNFKYAILSAIALVGAVSLTSCSSSDDLDANPTFDGESVKTQFSISLPSSINAPTTRMTGANVQQADNSFLGMQDIVLIPFATKPSATDSQLGEPIPLGDIDNSGLTALGTTQSPSTENYKVYSDVTVPLGTSAFLFYAQTKKQEGRTTTNKFDYGSTVKTAPATAGKAGYTFVPEHIFTGDYASANDNTIGNNIAAYLTQIAQTANWTNDDQVTTNEGLRNLYTSFTQMKAGSSFSVKRAVTDLYNSLKNNTDDLSKAIVTSITTTYASASEGVLTFDDDLIGGYPANLYLPDGVAQVSCNSSTGVFTISNDLGNYVFPAALWYRANTNIKVSNKKQTNNDNEYAGKTAWSGEGGILSLYTDGASVTSTTRSIALNDVIQYAVGRLDVRVKCAAEKLLDFYGNEIEVPDGGFPVSAVLVGGQRAVDFEFKNPSGDELTIYDKASIAADAGSYGSTNYTLALETPAESNVSICIELTNNTGDDFYGQNGQVIPNNSKFYLSTTLTATDATQTSSKVFKQDFYTQADLSIRVGSLSSSGTNSQGLGDATNTIPDLRTPQLELGLAVDLHWCPGHTYEINL